MSFLSGAKSIKTCDKLSQHCTHTNDLWHAFILHTNTRHLITQKLCCPKPRTFSNRNWSMSYTNGEERRMKLVWLHVAVDHVCHGGLSGSVSFMDAGDVKWLTWGQWGKGKTNCTWSKTKMLYWVFLVFMFLFFHSLINWRHGDSYSSIYNLFDLFLEVSFSRCALVI